MGRIGSFGQRSIANTNNADRKSTAIARGMFSFSNSWIDILVTMYHIVYTKSVLRSVILLIEFRIRQWFFRSRSVTNYRGNKAIKQFLTNKF